jgi:hypothetical protein
MRKFCKPTSTNTDCVDDSCHFALDGESWIFWALGTAYGLGTKLMLEQLYATQNRVPKWLSSYDDVLGGDFTCWTTKTEI